MRAALSVVWLLLLSYLLHGQCPPNTVPSSNNLIINPHFSLGNVNFTSQYQYCNTFNCLWPEATYAVGADASFFHTNFIGFDHTNPPNGFFMIVNGASTPNLDVWCQTVPVNPNTTYEFSVWVSSVHPTNPAVLQFKINGTLVGPTFIAPNTVNNWQQHYVTWNSGSNVLAGLCIVNQNTVTSGNDFGLDDLRFTECVPCQISQVIASPDTILCSGNSVQLHAQADTPATYSWLPAGVLNNAQLQSPLATPTQSTTFTVTAIDSIGCTRQDSVTVTIDQGPVFALQVADTLCAGDTAIMPLTTNATGVTWQWQPATGLSDPSTAAPLVFPSSTTLYTITAVGSTGCTSTATINIIVSGPPIANAGPDRVICGSTGFTQLSGSFSDTSLVTGYQWSPPTGLNNPNILLPAANPPQTQVYTLTVTNRWGCSSSDTARVQRVLLTIDAGPDRIICMGDTAQLQATNVPGLSYQWTPTATLSNPAIPDPQAFPASTQFYTLTVTDSNNCTAFDFVQVTVTSSPTIVLTPDTSLCLGDSLQLSAMGTNTFQWMPSTGLSCTGCANPVASPLATTTYTVIGSSGQGCSDTATVTITVQTSPVIQAHADTTICVGDTVPLWVTGGVSYVWSPGTSLGCTNCPSPAAYPIGNTVYTVSVTDINGCTTDTTVTVSTQQGPPIIVSNDTAICSGTSAQLQVSGGSSYAWAPASTLNCATCPNPIAQPTATTTYTVTAFNPIGCNTVDTVQVIVSGQGAVTISGDSVVCSGFGVQWIATGALTYQWSPANGLSCTACPNPMVQPSGTTTYTLQVTDSLGCIILPVVRTLTVNPGPVAGVAYADTVCQGTVSQLLASGGVQFQWMPATGLSCATCPNPSVVVNQDVSYNVVVTDSFGCRDTATVFIAARPAPALSTSSNMAICSGDTVLVGATSIAPVQWVGGGWIQCDTCPFTNVWPPVSATVYALATDNLGCSSTDSVEITVHALPNVLAIPDTTICSGEPVSLLASGAQAYNWSPAASLSCSNCPDPVAVLQQSQVYIVTGTDSNGCNADALVAIQVVSVPVPSISADTTICDGGQATLNVSGGVHYIWSPAQYITPQGGANVLATPSQSTTFTVTVADSQGCTSDTTVTVVVHVPLPLIAGPDTTICPGAVIQLYAFNAVSYSWVPSQFIDTVYAIGPQATPMQPITYTVTGTDAMGCEVVETVTINVFPSPTAYAGLDQTIRQGGTAMLSGSGGVTYLWTPPHLVLDPAQQTVTTVHLYDTTLFYFRVTDANGCEAIDSVWVFILPEVHIIVPNAFSPNGDGRNDLFLPVYDPQFLLLTFEVYNRWGQMVFSTTDTGTGWDGTHSGQPMPLATYVYMLRGTTQDGRPVEMKGNVTLIR